MDRARNLVKLSPDQPRSFHIRNYKPFYQGLLLTFCLAILASSISKLPYLSIMGTMVIAIFLGMLWRGVMDIPAGATAGIQFSTKYLLRAGIIIMGVRLNLESLLQASSTILVIDLLVVSFTFAVVGYAGKAFSLDKRITILVAAGTAICGAAAIMAISPLLSSRKEHTAISIACISLLGTMGTLLYILAFQFLPADPYQYGLFVGATLQELGHVVAAAHAGGEISSEIAILSKLGRVSLLIPIALIVSCFFTDKREKKTSMRSLPIPWFILGFLLVSLLHSFHFIPSGLVPHLVDLSVFLLAMSMAGIGLGIVPADFKKAGIRAILVGLIGFIALGLLVLLLLHLH
ncbi:YeiH family protein [Ammoniphilus sp. 3BR4]|uniref:YeiH family protein n=1 Tax=Ammoniphilus sp. 3BR4 TaxID=3158265 RepID=UPI0034653144